MNIKHHLVAGIVFVFLLDSVAFGQGTAFRYQGRLNDGGSPANGYYDLQFALYDASTNGNQVGPAQTNSATAVNNGLFAVTLDFGNTFSGSNYWLAVGVRTNGNGTFTTLNPLQPITPVPYAIFAGATSNLLGAVPAAQLSGTLAATQLPPSVVTNGASGLNLTGTFNGNLSGNGGGVTNYQAANLVNDATVAAIFAPGSLPNNITFYSYDFNSTNFLTRGGTLRPNTVGAYGAYYDRGYIQTSGSGAQQMSAMTTTFGTDGNMVIVRVSGNNEVWGLFVNGIDTGQTVYVPNDGNDHFYQINFATAATRTITLNGAWPFLGVYIPATNSLLNGQSAPVLARMAVLGDSFTEDGFTGTANAQGLSHQLQRLFPQLDLWAFGEGGTGYVNPGSGRTSFVGRVGDVVSANPNYVLVYGGINDQGYCTSTSFTNIFYSAATNLFFQLKAQLPNAKIAAIGPQWPKSTSPSSDPYLWNCAFLLSNACQAAGINYVNPLAPPWITGWYNVPGSGNAVNYTYTDGTHPSVPAGATYYASRIAQAVAQFWNLSAPVTSPVGSPISVVTNGIPPVPVAGVGFLWNSNSTLYWVTTSHTNYISGP